MVVGRIVSGPQIKGASLDIELHMHQIYNYN